MKPPAVDSLLLLEGVSRAGKMLLGKLVSNCRNIEFFQLAPVLDHIPILAHLGVLSRENAVAYLRLNVDSLSYDRAVGRNLNTRTGDATSLTQALNLDEYLGRAATPDAATAWERFQKVRRTPAYLVHEMMPHIDLYFDAVPELRVIHVDRHPVDLCYSWFQRGWGDRWGTDPLAFVPAIDHHGRPVPWFAVDWADEYCSAAPVDRIVRSLVQLREQYRAKFDGLSTNRNQRIARIAYEGLVEHPWETMKSVEAFLDTAVLDGFATVLKRERLPGKPPAGDRCDKLTRLASIMLPRSAEMLAAAARDYETLWA